MMVRPSQWSSNTTETTTILSTRDDYSFVASGPKPHTFVRRSAIMVIMTTERMSFPTTTDTYITSDDVNIAIV
jgi:hypothetical protein